MRSDSKLGIVVSTTDLLKYLSCEELSVLDLLASQGRAAPLPVSDTLQLAAKLGLASESDVLGLLEERYGKAIRITGRDLMAFEETVSAMKSGADLIYQGLILREMDGLSYESRPDFLIKVDQPSKLGAHSYEPVDSKLSKSTKLEDLFQVLDYADALAMVQDILPRRVHLFLAGIEQLSYKTEAYIEEVRLQRERFLSHVLRSGSEAAGDDLFSRLDPKPNRRCVICDWAASCEAYWERSDSLFRVANITKSQVARLNAAGVTSLSGLANSAPTEIEAGISSEVLQELISQARVQATTMASGQAVPYFEVRADAFALANDERGLGLLPKPSEGDIFFDIEGDPFYKPDGLEYLFGIAFKEGETVEFKAFWGTDPDEEKKAFGELVDFIMERWRRFGDLHVYHYADYERSALSRLASRCNFKVFEVDTILRNELLVDLFPAVRGALFLGADSYSLKKVEKLYLSEGRQEAVTTALGSVESFEAWLNSGDPEILSEIERYNETDVRSTFQLREFLLSVRSEIVAREGEFPFRGEGSKPEEVREPSDREQELQKFETELSEMALLAQDMEERRSLKLCGDLISFHAREEKPNWWRYFNLISPERSRQDFLSESGCIGGLKRVTESSAQSGEVLVTYSFEPHQPFKIGGETLLDPELQREIQNDHAAAKAFVPFGKVQKVDFVVGLIEIKRDKNYPKERDPKNLIAWSYVPTGVVEKAVQRFAGRVVANGGLCNLHDVGAEILLRNRPRFNLSGQSFSGIDNVKGLLGGAETDDATALAISAAELLDHSYLLIQGPPGAGKTFLSAQVAAKLVSQGKKVFVTALSHSAIDNLIEALLPMMSDGARILRVNGGKAKRQPGVRFIKAADIEPSLRKEGGLLVGGTIWNASRAELEKGFDYGFVDEAGQFSMADAIALTSSCQNLVLTGDPQQLSQPVTGSHPDGAASSVLEHLVGDRDLVDPDYGLFLRKTFRMHPRLTEVVSAISYDSQLSSIGELERLELLDSHPFPRHGIAYLPVEHENNTYRSPEEVEVAKRVAEFLLERSWIDRHGNRLLITPEDIMVVAPYNAQTNALTAALGGLASVGTVDKFQGREAPFVIVSLSASDGQSSSRGVDFLFSTNRLNVAISRAKVMSIILASPTLIETKPETVDQLELLGAVTKVIKVSTRVDPTLLP